MTDIQLDLTDVVVYREPEWCIVTMKDDRGPWVVHYCVDKFTGSFKWHHVISTPAGRKNYPNNQYGCCLECKRKA